MVQTNSVNNKIVILMGATAVGKTSLSIQLAKKYNFEIISVDSMQIFRKLNIGTGKITQQEMDGTPHHLIDIIEPQNNFSVFDFVTMSKNKMEEIWSRGKIPLFVGGTGLYINALLNGHNFCETNNNDEVREKYKEILSTKGQEYLHSLLKTVDPASAEKISISDTKRVIRALEIFETTGKPKSEIAATSSCSYNYLFLILNKNREELYNKINKRVDSMFENGLVDEVKSLLEYKDCQSMQAIGYKEVIEFLENKIDFATCKDKIKQNSRHYAKRQLTYFRWLNANKLWFDISEIDKITANIENFIVL